MLLDSIIRRVCDFFTKKTVRIISDYLPEYKTKGSACFDFVSTETHLFTKNELFNLGTGVRCEIPRGWCMLVFSRSSLGQKKMIIPNSVGVIDSDYRGEIKVPLISLNDEPVLIEKGARVAQGMLVKVNQARFVTCDALSETDRGCGGFGSTGK